VEGSFLTQRRKGKGKEAQSQEHLKTVSKDAILPKFEPVFQHHFLFPFAPLR